MCRECDAKDLKSLQEFKFSPADLLGRLGKVTHASRPGAQIILSQRDSKISFVIGTKQRNDDLRLLDLFYCPSLFDNGFGQQLVDFTTTVRTFDASLFALHQPRLDGKTLTSFPHSKGRQFRQSYS